MTTRNRQDRRRANLLVRSANFSPSSINEEARTVELVWTTGARVIRGMFSNYYEELSVDSKHVRMGRLASGTAPLLAVHDQFSLKSVIGVVESASIAKGKGVATVRFAKDDTEADSAWNKVKQGILRNVSVGYVVHKTETIEQADNKIPIRRAIDWEPYEISLVAIPADSQAQVRNLKPAGRTSMNDDDNELDLNDNDSSPNDDEGGSVPVVMNRSERNRVDTITRQVQAATASATRHGISAELALRIQNRAITRGMTPREVRAILLDEMVNDEETRSLDSTKRVELVEDHQDKFMRGATAWLFEKAGHTATVEQAIRLAPKRFAGVETDPGEFRGRSLLDLARDCLERGGVRTRGLSKHQLVSRAFTFRSGGMHSTSDFGNLLENAQNKLLLTAYAITPDNWSKFCFVSSVTDFKPQRRLRMGSFARLDKLNEHGEFKNKVIPDAELEKIAASTYGNIIGITREAIINDDLDSMSRLSVMLGRAAKLSIEMDVFALITSNSGLGPTMDSDNKTLFHADHGNIGTGAAIASGSLDADATLMASQTDVSKNEILDLAPSILLVPRSLRGEANSLNDAVYDTDTSGKFQKPNKVRGLFNIVVGTARLPGTRRYLLADPAVAPVFEVVFLDGQQEPFLDSRDGWRTDGIEWKVRLDYGVDAVDYRGAVTNAGA